MTKVVFEMPENGFNSKKDGGPLSATTQAVYKSKLNSLAVAGYPNVAAVWKSASKVIKVIKELTGDGDTDADKMKRRQFLSAIFAVSPEAKMTKSNFFYRYYQQCLPGVNAATGEAWVKKKDMA
jgi:hypothetical protein